MTNVALMPQRPPYVEFEERTAEDRNETIKQGKLVLRTVNYAIIRPIGGKDAIEKEAEPWLDHIQKQADMGIWPQDWPTFFREQYARWKQGQEIGPTGTHVRNWAAISRAQAEMLIAARLLTVEDLAQANEEALQRVGMGARELQARARVWLEVAAKNGSAEELHALRVKAEDQDRRIADLLESNNRLAAQVEALQGDRKRKAS